MAQLVYVSHLKADADLAARLRADLAAAGVPLASDRHTVGVNWANAIGAASHVIVCVSANGYPEEEVAHASNRLLLPVKLTPSELPAPLAGITALDLFDDWAGGVAHLVAALMPAAKASAAGKAQDRTKIGQIQIGGDLIKETIAGPGVVESTLEINNATVDGSAKFITGGNS